MEVFDLVAEHEHEQVVFLHDRSVGLRGIVAVHSTRLGPALGGTRFWPYPSERDALVDVLRLSKAMTYKSAVAGVDLGGGKAVLIGDPATLRSEALIRAYGRFVNALGGRYVTAEDVGTTQADMDLIARETPHVTGVSPALGGSGDPSGPTAWGVFRAMGVLSRRLWGDEDLAGRRVCVSGVGKVGSILVGYLVEAGAHVTVADVDAAKTASLVASHAVEVTEPAKAHATECDIFSPCALGGVLDERTIPELRCAAVCGSANNQLATEADAERLADAGVLFAPDFVVNAGGIINVAEELHGYDRDRAMPRVAAIGERLDEVLDTAEAERLTPTAAAVRVADRRIAALGAIAHLRTFRARPIHHGHPHQ